jgi:predicted ATPase
LHWIDEETQALLNLLVERATSARLLLLVSYRPEYRHDWGNKAPYRELRVEPLGSSNAEEMIVSILPHASDSMRDNDRRRDRVTSVSPITGAASLATLSRLIIERTAGNPLFIEEMVQALFAGSAQA